VRAAAPTLYLSVESLSPRSFRLRTAATRLPRKLSVKAAAPSLHCLLCLFPIVYVAVPAPEGASPKAYLLFRKARSPSDTSTSLRSKTARLRPQKFLKRREEEEELTARWGLGPDRAPKINCKEMLNIHI